jgi:transcriptional regulator
VYIPPAFKVTDSAKLEEVITSNSFGTLISRDGDSVFASHLPFLYRPQQGANGKLLCHMARANRHWKLFNETDEVLAIFYGPHAYISPSWYVAHAAVPTWNYVTVHVYGRARLLEAEKDINEVLNQTVEKHEATMPQPWTPNLPEEMRVKLQQAIVAFEIEITRIEGKFKLGQNRSPEDREKMLNALKTSDEPESNRLAQVMEREFKTL